MDRTLAILITIAVASCAPAPAPAPDGGATLDAGVDAAMGPAAPALLSQTGLYGDIGRRALAPGVFRYTLQFPVWTDGTISESFLLLPPGTKIDTSNMDGWVFPVGTKAWRELRVGDVVVETRFLQKIQSNGDGWLAMSYTWDDKHADAKAVKYGAKNVLGTSYSILPADQCILCHAMVRDQLIGTSAVQLSRPDGKGPLSQLAGMGALSHPPMAEFTVPGNAQERAALGYLHANCGYCHSAESPLKRTLTMDLDLRTTDVAVAETHVYKTAINAKMFHPMPPDIDYCVVPQNPAKSQLWARMGLRDDWAMPNLDTVVVDKDGVALIRDWIDSLPK